MAYRLKTKDHNTLYSSDITGTDIVVDSPLYDTDECAMCGETIRFGEKFCSIDCKNMYHYGE